MKKQVVIDVAETLGTPSALTQEQGDVIYKMITSEFDNQASVILDFSQVESMISPFLNNAIGQLYGTYTSDQLQSLLVFRNFPDEKKSTLNIVISNAKRFYSNRDKFNSVAEEVFNS